jgi:hypothetical protein
MAKIDNRWKPQSFRFNPEVTDLLQRVSDQTFQTKTDVLVQGLRLFAIREGIPLRRKEKKED